MLPGFLLPNTGIPRSKKGAIDSSCKSKLSSIPCFFNIPPSSSVSNTAVVWRKVVLVQKMILIHSTVILKRPLFWDSSLYELNSIKIACKCVPLIKPKTIPIVFIWLKEGPLWPTSVNTQGPQLFVRKPKWHAPLIVVKKVLRCIWLFQF